MTVTRLEAGRVLSDERSLMPPLCVMKDQNGMKRNEFRIKPPRLQTQSVERYKKRHDHML